MKFNYPIDGVKEPINYHFNNTVGFYPIGRLFNWHGGIHVGHNSTKPIKAIADGVIIACRIPAAPIQSQGGNYSNGFVLIQHKYKTTTGREIIFYSLYNNLSTFDEMETAKKFPEVFTVHKAKVQGGIVVRDGATGENLRLKSNKSKFHKSYVENYLIANDTELTLGNNGKPIGKYYEVIKINDSAVKDAVMWKGSVSDPVPDIGVAKNTIVSGADCNIPIKAGEVIGFVGPHGYKQNKNYRAAHIEVFTDKDPSKFLTGIDGDKDDVTDSKRYLKIKKGAKLTLKYPTKFVSGDEVKVLKIEGDFCKIKLHKQIRAVNHEDLTHIDSDKNGNVILWAKYNPKNLDNLNKEFNNVLNKSSVVEWVENLPDENGKKRRKVSFTLDAGDCDYWVDKAGQFDLTEVPANSIVLNGDLDVLYKRKPKDNIVEYELGDDYINALTKIKSVKSDVNTDEWLYLKIFTPQKKGSYYYQTEVEGYIKKDIEESNKDTMELISPFDWEAFGFKIYNDQPDEFVFQPSQSPAFLTSIWKYIGNGDNDLTASELATSIKDPFVAGKMSKMICHHQSEWGVDAASLSSEVETLLNDGIGEATGSKKEALETEKKEILDALKEKLAQLDFWNDVKVKESAENSTEEEKSVPFPTDTKVYHFHPVAFVEQMKRHGSCFCNKDITVEAFEEIFGKGPWFTGKSGIVDMKTDYPDVYNISTQTFVDALNTAMKKYEINSCLQKAHFIAQCYHESGLFKSTAEYDAGNDYDIGTHKALHESYKDYCTYLKKYSGIVSDEYTKHEAKIESQFKKYGKAYDKYKKATQTQKLTDEYKELKDMYDDYPTFKTDKEKFDAFKSNYNKWKYSYYRYTECRNNGNKDIGDGKKYRGRGLIQLTWKGTYKRYKEYSGVDYITNYKSISSNIENACDVSGWFWRNGKRKSNGDIIDLNKDANKDDFIMLTYLINGGGLNGFTDRYNKTLDLLNCFGVFICANKSLEREAGDYSINDSRISTWRAPYKANKSPKELNKLGNRIVNYVKTAKDSRAKYLQKKGN